MENPQEKPVMNITVEAAEECANETNTNFLGKSTAKFKKVVFDEKNYLNVKLNAGDREKKLKIRLLPIDNGKPFKKVFMHTVHGVPKELSPSGIKSYVCLEHSDGFDKNYVGEKCPFCEVNREAYKLYQEATTAEDQKKFWDVVKANIPQEVFIMRCIERGKEEDGTKFWKVNGSRINNGVRDKIMEIYKQRRNESIEAKDVTVDNIFDIYTGRDINVTVSKGIEKDSKVAYNPVDDGRPSPLSKDENLVMQWVNDEKKWFDVFPPKPYDYLKIVMIGEVPWYDKDNKKWVTKDEFNGIQKDNTEKEETEQHKTDESFSNFGANSVNKEEDLPF